jgi:hypothetical protein
LKHRTRRALAVVAVLASTLVAGTTVNEPVAQATPNYYMGWSNYDVQGGFRGYAEAVTTHECGNPVSGWVDEYISLSVEDVVPGEYGDRVNNYLFTPGSTATLRLEESITKSGSCNYSDAQATSITVSIRYMDRDNQDESAGTQIGTTTWTVNPTTQNWLYTRQIEFDVNPLDGTVGTPLAGSFELYFEGTAPGGATFNTRGSFNIGTGPSLFRNQAGYLVSSNGMMAGEDPDAGNLAGIQADEAALGKNMPVMRMFKSSWGVPQAGVGTVAAAGKLVMWSNKPSFTPSAGRSVWYDIANGTKDSGTGNLDDQITTLANYATATGAPGQAVLIFGHEPHDDASDVKCSSGCFGTAQEFRAAFAHVKARINALGKQNIIKLAYTAVDSQAVASGNDGVSGGPTVIGGGDKMYPGNPNRKCDLAGVTNCVSSNVDVLGHDVYNYYQYKAGGGGPPNYQNGTWRSLKYKLLDANNGQIPLAKRLNKKLLIAELGSHPGCLNGDTAEGCNLSGVTLSVEPYPINWLGSMYSDPATRSEWFWNGLRAVEQDTDAVRYLLGFSYFHLLADWDWRFINRTGQVLDAFHQRGTGCRWSYPNCLDINMGGWLTAIVDTPMFKSTPISL